LRSYGTLSGDQTRWQMPGGHASLLQIHCDDEAKAKIVHAKYLSDLTEIDGVRKVDGVQFPHWEMAGDKNVLYGHDLKGAGGRFVVRMALDKKSSGHPLPILG
ncbi:MAG: hypothetical protein ACLQDA_17835, partial [Terracidiphilus sp.]